MASVMLAVSSAAGPSFVVASPTAAARPFRLAPHPHGGDAEQVLAAFNRAGVDLGQLAAQLQEEGAKAFVASWKDLVSAIENKGKCIG